MIWDDAAGIGTIEDILNAAESAAHIDRAESSSGTSCCTKAAP